MTMIVSKDAIKRFVEANHDACPFSEIKSTRSGYYCKWLLFKCKGTVSGIMRANRGHQIAMLTSSADVNTFHHLLISGQAYPLTPDMEHIQDVMEVWGRNHSAFWHQRVLLLFQQACENPHRFSDNLTRKFLILLCIRIRVDEVVKKHFAFLYMQDAIDELTFQWHCAFHDMYEHTTKDYFELVICSMRFLDKKINHALSGQLAPHGASEAEEEEAEERSTPDEASSSSMVTVSSSEE